MTLKKKNSILVPLAALGKSRYVSLNIIDESRLIECKGSLNLTARVQLCILPTQIKS